MAVIAPRKIGIIADVHANQHALKAVLAHQAMKNVDLRVCCGDMIGYGAKPNECLDLLRAQQFSCLCGNHERGVLDLSFAEQFFNDQSLEAIKWTTSQLTPDNCQFLQQLPERLATVPLVGGQIVEFTHGSLSNPAEQYLFTTSDSVESFNLMSNQLCFVGHTHQPMIIEKDNGGKFHLNGNFYPNRQNLLATSKYIINPGSVGQPRDLDSRASFAVYDSATGIIELFRVNYDVSATQQEIYQAGLPNNFAERLEQGT